MTVKFKTLFNGAKIVGDFFPRFHLCLGIASFVRHDV